MNKSLLAGAAFAAVAAVGMPILAWSADADTGAGTPMQIAQQAAPAASDAVRHGEDQGAMANRPMGDRPMAGQMGAGHPDGWGQRWHHFWGMQHAMKTPQQRCEERLARRAGFRAYIEARLNLTAAQRPLADKLQAAFQTADDKQHQLCATLKPRSERASETLLDRMDQREQFLSARLNALQAEKPALDALYQSLTPEQQAIVNHPFRR